MHTIKISSPFGWNHISYDFIKQLTTAVMPDVTLGSVRNEPGAIILELSRVPTSGEIDICKRH